MNTFLRYILSVVLAALIVLAVFPAVLSRYRPLSAGSFTLAHTGRGAELFKTNCVFCHSLDGSLARGPSVKDLGLQAGSRREGYSAEQYLIESIVDPTAFSTSPNSIMPQVATKLTDSEVRDLVAYLMSQGGVVDRKRIDGLPIARPPEPPPRAPVRLDWIVEGEQIFRGKGGCVQCHFPSSYLAPSLETVGLQSEEYLRNSIVDPYKHVAEAYRVSVIETDGGVVSGVIVQQDADSMTIALTNPASDGSRIMVIPLEEIVRGDDGQLSIKTTDRSIMPSFSESLTPHEVDCLVELMRNLY
jgi:mono/diheme cytochrome c family protein